MSDTFDTEAPVDLPSEEPFGTEPQIRLRRYWKLGIVLIVLIVLGAGSLLLRGQTTQQLQVQQPMEQISTAPIVASPTPQKPTLMRYTTDQLKYGFEYMAQNKAIECSDHSCVAINDLSVSVIVLSKNLLFTTTPRQFVGNSNLLCDVDGPTVSIRCNTNTVEDYTSRSGVAGFKVSRTKIITGSYDIPAGEYNDEAYVFFLPHSQPASGKPEDQEYTGLLFVAQYPRPEDIANLDIVAASLFTM